VITAKKILGIAIIFILIVWAIVIFFITPHFIIYLILGFAFLVALYLFFKKGSDDNNFPKNKPRTPIDSNQPNKT
jgi:hypothetical protein